jgi:putative Mg2+ transporter-C (MgtC) family protein
MRWIQEGQRAHVHGVSEFELLPRIVLATVLAAVIGFERDAHGHPAGLRTHATVGLASATFMIVSTRLAFYQHYGAHDYAHVDFSRIAASVVSGIGFLGAGAILRTGLTIKGLTTAASLWLVAAIGLASGSAMYGTAVVVTAIGLGALMLLRRVEDRRDPLPRSMVTLLIDHNLASVQSVIETLARSGAKATEQEYEHVVSDGSSRVTLEIRTTTALDNRDLVKLLEGHSGIREIKVQRL